MTPPLRILHLEDNARDAELIQATLESDGLAVDVRRVDTQADFRAALAQRFDVILADNTLPGLDGMSALAFARAACPHVPFIFVSGTLGEEVPIEALKRGATDYVLKQHLSRIGPSVQRALREAKEREERARAEAVLAGEKRLLEMIAKGDSVAAILDDLCGLVEALEPSLIASIRLLDPDDQRFPHGAAPSLPESQNVETICSTPVRASDGRVLATVAICAREPRRPTEAQRTLIERVTDLASIAIERKHADDERQAHLWILERVDRVNRAIQSTNDLEEMMSKVLEAVLGIFDCDRAWLVYPCDPDAALWRVPMEHTRPEFPGAFALGVHTPIDAETAATFTLLRASTKPVRFGTGSDHPLPVDTARRFGIQSMIALAIHPKGDRPYVLGLHQCSAPRVWTLPEERLFQEIGRRLEDALTSVLILRGLRESERRLEEAQRISHVGYWEREVGTNRSTWSDETWRILGLSPEARSVAFGEVVARVHPADRERRETAIAEALQGGPRYDIEYRMVRPSGEVRFVRSQGDVLRDESGRPRRLFGTLQDITERKLAEQRLLAQHDVTQILAAAATLEDATPHILRAVCNCLNWDVGALWRVDREGGMLRCVEFWHTAGVAVPDFEAASRNAAFRPGVGLPGRVWARRAPVYVPDVVHDPEFPRAPIVPRELLHAGFGVPIVLGRDVLGVMEFFSNEIRQPDQDLLAMMAVIGSQIGQFIERKRAEEALAHARAEVAHVARVATLGELSASIAHEINQPLAAVVNNAMACVNWLDADNVAQARESAALIMADGHRAGEIINRIRALAKKGTPRKDAVDINAMIFEVIALMRHELHAHGVSAQTALDTELPAVQGDRIQLQQVLLNLMMNAVEAMSGNSSAPRELSITSASADAGAVLIIVADSGAGLSAATRERLFEAFHTTKPQGMGMGLAISRSIVEAHGGRLWAADNEPRGAVFQFTLPIGPLPK